MSGKRIGLLILAVLIVVSVFSIYLLRGWISSRIYTNEGNKLAAKLPPELKDKYGEELKYTLDKFWSCYTSEIVTQNDMTDVMERMKRLREKKEIKDRDVFDFIGYVSKIYSVAMHEHHKKQMTE